MHKSANLNSLECTRAVYRLEDNFPENLGKIGTFKNRGIFQEK